MLKMIKKIIVILILTFTLIIAFPSKHSSAASESGVDFRNGIIKYILEKRLIDAPNTFEAWIQIAENETGYIGTIFGNVIPLSSANVSFYVNNNGNLCANWNNFEKDVVFDSYDLRTNKWEHVAVVRDEKTNSFIMYLNGEVKQVMEVGCGSKIGILHKNFCIGGDYYSRQTQKYPFKGKIKQVTAYSNALNENEIYRDYINSSSISKDTRKHLIFNAELLPSSVIAYDTSAYENHAYLGSNDYFYEDEMFETQDYTLAVIPDIQMITYHYPSAVKNLPNYLLSVADEKKIGVAITVGDITDGGSNDADWKKQYKTISTQLNRLLEKMPYIVTAGNHDYDDECKTDHSLSYLNSAFKHSEISQWSSWGGSLSNDSVVNAYYLMEFYGVKYLFISIDYAPTNEVLEWACNVTEQYPDHRVIVSTHGYLDGDGRVFSGMAKTIFSKETTNDASEMWDKWLRKYPNIFMLFCGHVITDDIIITEQVGDYGNVMAAILVNGQGIINNDGLENLVSLMSFDEENQQVYINYYSTIQNKLYNFQNQFIYSFAGNTNILSTEVANSTPKTNTSRKMVLKNIVDRTNFFQEDIIDSKIDTYSFEIDSTILVVISIISVITLIGVSITPIRRKDGQ